VAEQLRSSIVVIGDEILGGFVDDANSGWLARRLHALGIPLDRVVVTPDSLEAIAEALSGELARPRPRVVLTSGGIGSTPDDCTYEAVAHTLSVALTTEPEIDRRISAAVERSAANGVTLTAEHERSMRKMARVPEGSYILAGAGGIAPGVAVDVDGGTATAHGATIGVLPGIPGELQRITTEGIEPALLHDRGRPQHVAETTHSYPESAVNPLLDALVAEFPDVHVGSYPGRECVIRLQGEADRVEAAMERVRSFLESLAQNPAAQRMAASWRARWTG
jgi:molybdopterin-biosynthesis enzyme MoeA-like protein